MHVNVPKLDRASEEMKVHAIRGWRFLNRSTSFICSILQALLESMMSFQKKQISI